MHILRPMLLFLFLTITVRSAPADKAKEEWNIREVTYRYQFEHNASGRQKNSSCYYLDVATTGKKDTDPPSEFIKRFEGHKPAVKPASECEVKSEKGVIDKKTGEPGLIFTTGEIKWISDTEVEISGGYYEAGLSSSGNTYHLKKIKGKWTVWKNVMHWIS